jgi:hypothetical protein
MIFYRINSPHIDYKSAEATSEDHSFVATFFIFCVILHIREEYHPKKKNIIIHKRRYSFQRDAADKINHDEIRSSDHQMSIPHYMISSRGFVFWVQC